MHLPVKSKYLQITLHLAHFSILGADFQSSKRSCRTSFLSPSCILTRFGHLLELAAAQPTRPRENFILAFEDGLVGAFSPCTLKEHRLSKNIPFRPWILSSRGLAPAGLDCRLALCGPRSEERGDHGGCCRPGGHLPLATTGGTAGLAPCRGCAENASPFRGKQITLPRGASVWTGLP